MSDDTRRIETVDYDASYPPTLWTVVPVLTALTPNTSVVGVPVTVTVTGTGFLPSSVVRADGSPLPTAYVSPTTLTVTGTPLTDGVANVTVANGSSVSNVLVYTVTNVAGLTQSGPGRRRRATWTGDTVEQSTTPEDLPADGEDEPDGDTVDDDTSDVSS